ncbi:MAG: alpha/beta hydrolase [Polyangiaceae bacterium]
MSTRLHVTTTGTGVPVLLLHSGGMSARQWRPLMAELEKKQTYRVIAPDFIGSGDNDPWDVTQGAGSDFKFEMDVEALLEVVQSLGAPVHVVGHSYGGFIALMLGLRAPYAIRSLSLYDPVAFGVLHASGDAIGLADLDRAASNPVFNDRAQCGTDAWFEVFVDYWNGKGSWRALPKPTREGFLRIGQKVFFEVYSLMQDRTPAAAYAHLRVPTLLLTGDHSPPAAHRVVELLAEAMHGRSVFIRGAGHMGPITHGLTVNAHIVSFLDELTSMAP